MKTNKRNFMTRLTCILLCFCMLVPMIAACGNTSAEDKKSWEFNEENTIGLAATVDKSGENAVIVITHPDGIFSSAKSEQIRLVAYRKVENTGGEAEKRWMQVDVDTFSATLDSADQITVTLPNNDLDDGYMVIIHPSAITTEKFGEAFAMTEEFSGVVNFASAAIFGDFAMGDVDPTIVMELENAFVSDAFGKELITLTGLFEELEIVDATVSDGAITITTKGTIPYKLPFIAGVELDKSATSAAAKISADTSVSCRASYIDQKSFAFADGALSFKALLLSDTTTLAVGDTITENETVFTVAAVSADKKEITFTAKTDVADLDAAIKQINGKTLTIPENKTGSEEALTLIVYANEARVNAYIDYIEKTDAANTYKATVSLIKINGVWTGDLVAADLSFGGDFDTAAVQSIKKNGETFEIELSFVKEDIDLDYLALNATLSVAAAKIKNFWGTHIENGSVELTYVSPTDRKVTAKSLIDFAKEAKGKYDTVKEIAETVSKINPTDVAGTAKSIKKILVLAGIIEKPKKTTLDTLKSQIEDVQRSIRELDQKLDSMGALISLGNAETVTEIQRTTYVAASGNWSNFISNYVNPLQDKISEYNSAFNEYMLNYIGKAHTAEGAIDLYIDSENQVTIVHPLTPTFSVDGLNILKSGKYIVSAELSTVISKLMQNRGRLYEGYWDDIDSSITDIVPIGDSPEVTKEEYILAVQMSAAMYAMEKVGTVEIINAYTNFCRALTGQGTNVAMKPIDSYLTILSVYYNFYIEAKDDIETTLAWLSGLLIETTGIAMLAYDLSPSLGDGIIGENFSMAVEKIEEASKGQNDLFCFISNKGTSSVYIEKAYDHFSRETSLPCFAIRGDIRGGGIVGQVDNNIFAPGTIATDTQLIIMMKRYEKLKSLGITSAETFQDYLVGLGILREGLITSPWYKNADKTHVVNFLTSNPRKSKIPLNKTVTVQVIDSWTSYVKEGANEKVGAHGEKSCFKMAEQIKGDILYQNGTIAKDALINAGVYYYEKNTFRNWLIDTFGATALRASEEWVGAYALEGKTFAIIFE